MFEKEELMYLLNAADAVRPNTTQEARNKAAMLNKLANEIDLATEAETEVPAAKTKKK